MCGASTALRHVYAMERDPKTSTCGGHSAHFGDRACNGRSYALRSSVYVRPLPSMFFTELPSIHCKHVQLHKTNLELIERERFL